MSKTPPRPQQSKRARAAAKKNVPVRAHARTFVPKDLNKPKPTRSLAERFRGSR
jgi:hypothetical protein